tara:strand:- start:175 stop:594 length:420 start_codon:yes stop_codon:yes gene_type:complete
MITGKQIEKHLGIKSDGEALGVYVGFQEIDGHRARTKIGRCCNPQPIQRARQQGGANWWYYSYFLLPTKEDTRKVDRVMKKQFKSQNIENTEQNQTELYYWSPEEATNELEDLLRSLGYEARDLVEEILENDLHKEAGQ